MEYGGIEFDKKTHSWLYSSRKEEHALAIYARLKELGLSFEAKKYSVVAQKDMYGVLVAEPFNSNRALYLRGIAEGLAYSVEKISVKLSLSQSR